ncbi:DUF6299 family protein [Streptomyces sp. NBC_01445]|uniref:DUF6299 family protein n=1 Tax=Streptomyces sp. NBC_01445 TaxID=2903869 RepID=UPI002DD89F33|nr:DUF6299 family protein [Streptomyces sp. NBC_01445]WSE09587.1 DUF6299 family protein [Streptomyces sp. NBC_01445]
MALTAVVVLSPSASADSFSGSISAHRLARIAPGGTLTLCGTYRCETSSSARAVFVSSNLVQDNKRLGFGGTEARCGGQEHERSSSGLVDGLMDLGFHEGRAAVDAHLMTLESDGGLPSRAPRQGRRSRSVLWTTAPERRMPVGPCARARHVRGGPGHTGKPSAAIRTITERRSRSLSLPGQELVRKDLVRMTSCCVARVIAT